MTRPHVAHLSLDEIDAWLDGTLAADARHHLDGCARCQDAVHAEREIGELLGSLPPLMPRPELADRVMASVRIPDPFAIRSLRTLPARLAANRRSLAAAAVLAIALVGSMVGSAVWMLAHQQQVFAWGVALLGHAGDLGWVAVRGAASNVLEQPWFGLLRDAFASPARIALAWAGAGLAYLAGLLALRRLLAAPTPRVANANW